MNFFEHQDRARRNTRRLVVYFILATVLIVVSVTVVVSLAAVYLERSPDRSAPVDGSWLADHAGLVLFSSLGTLGLIGFGSLSRTVSLRAGGGAVARELGGTQITPDEMNPVRRRVMNVVEEMAIASGVPVPEVYILEQETGINAFAAGFTPADAAVAVTRGTVERLTRDELQGVIAHEFSHIFNGDMRLNMRLIGVLYGILLIGITGQTLLRIGAYSGMMRSRREKGNAGLFLLAVGGALMTIGFAGVFFGRVIKAAVSRQREFLADASAVQFTRNPDGIAGALKKIGGYEEGSRLRAAKTEEISHMLFGSGSASLAGLFATHPPIEERIRALDPAFDAERLRPGTEAAAGDPRAAGFAGAAAPDPATRVAVDPDSVIASVGNPAPVHVAYAARVIETVPASLREAASHPGTAVLLALALMIGDEPDNRAAQLTLIERSLGPKGREEIDRFAGETARLGPRYRLPLLDLAFPSLKRLAPVEVERFLGLIQSLAAADRRITFAEFILARLLQTHLYDAFQPEAGARRLAGLEERVEDAVALLGAAAAIGADSAEAAHAAWAAGLRALGAPSPLGEPRVDYLVLDRALVRLDALSGAGKERLVRALVVTLARDGRVTEAEAELLRAVCDTLHIPVPPIVS